MSKKQSESGASLGEKIKLVMRSVRFAEECDKGRIFWAVIQYIPNLVSDFSAIFLSGLVIDGIAAARPVKELLIRAAAVCTVMLLSGVIKNLTDMHKNAHKFSYDSFSEKRLFEKLLKMDYHIAESTDTKYKYSQAKRYLSGYGIESVIEYLSYASVNIVKAAAGTALIAPIVFRENAAGGGFMGFIRSPWGFVSVIIISAALIGVNAFVIAPRLIKYDNEGLADKETDEAIRVGNSAMARTLYNYRFGKEIRIYGEQELMLQTVEESNKKFCSRWEGQLKKMYPLDMAESVIKMLIMLIMYAFALLRAAGGMMTPGEIVIFASYFGQIRSGITNAAGCMGQMLERTNFCREVFDFLDTPDDKYMGTLPTEKREDNDYEFEFRHVYFKYPGTEDYILKDINLKWRVGEKMALVGRNGSGKSTLIKLLCRLYDPTEGVITLNGIDITKYSLKEYTELFSVVFQDSALFSFSIAENVAADTEYDPAKVEECVRRAGFSDRLKSCPEGIKTVLYKDFSEKGVEISGGEAQKLCLARAVYKGAAFIVLDEPTAALDPVSEYDIYTKFNSIVGTRTAIYISHRLSSCRFCDDITVLDKGRIAERGSHSELVLKGGVYAKMWNAQAEYYRDTAGELYV